jgi:hypothetical protein
VVPDSIFYFFNLGYNPRREVIAYV